jgi:hypothetical protein
MDGHGHRTDIQGKHLLVEDVPRKMDEADILSEDIQWIRLNSKLQ